MSISAISTTGWVLVIAFVVVLAAGVAVFLSQRKRRTERLRTQFGGAEYARAVEKDGDRRHAEAALEERTQRVERFHVRPLAAADRARFVKSWSEVQRASSTAQPVRLRQRTNCWAMCYPRGAIRQPDLNSRRQISPWIIHWFWQTIVKLTKSRCNRRGGGQHGRTAPGNGSLPDAFRGTGQRAGDAASQGRIISKELPCHSGFTLSAS